MCEKNESNLLHCLKCIYLLQFQLPPLWSKPLSSLTGTFATANSLLAGPSSSPYPFLNHSTQHNQCDFFFLSHVIMPHLCSHHFSDFVLHKNSNPEWDLWGSVSSAFGHFTRHISYFCSLPCIASTLPLFHIPSILKFLRTLPIQASLSVELSRPEY